MAAAPGRRLPLVEPLHPLPDVEECLSRPGHVAALPVLRHARRYPVLGRYSFLAADPFAFFQVPADGSDALATLAHCLSEHKATTVPDLPPFQGGAAGLFGYDLDRSLERLPRPAIDEFQMPALAVGVYDVILAIDHHAEQAWIISHGFPEHEPARRQRRARRRLIEFRQSLTASLPADNVHRIFQFPIRPDQLAPAISCAGTAGPDQQLLGGRLSGGRSRGRSSTSTPATSFRSTSPSGCCIRRSDDAVELYLRLRQRNPATFAGYFDLGDFQIVSASPERFLQVRRRPGRNPADQGHAAADAPARGRPVRRRRPAAKREGPGRERDDRRSAAQRSVARLPARQRPRDAALPAGNLRVRAAPGLGRARRAARRATAARPAAGRVSRRLDHRRPEGAGHGDHRRAGADRPRPVLRLAGLPRLRRHAWTPAS